MKKLYIILVCFFLASNQMLVFAQDVPPVPEDPLGAGGAVPLDAGLTALLVAGAGYGAKKAYDYRKKNKKDRETGSPKE